jgi:hypothetical protein
LRFLRDEILDLVLQLRVTFFKSGNGEVAQIAQVRVGGDEWGWKEERVGNGRDEECLLSMRCG